MKRARQVSLILCAGAALADEAPPPLDCAAFPRQDKSPYLLPFEPGTTRLVSNTTGHYTPSNGGVGLYAIDIPMPIGTRILAARAGEVVAVREHFEDGNGIDLEENFVFVRHVDGTIARYFHLMKDGANVRVEDDVEAGDLIGFSGNTGQTEGPHLHFDVQLCGPNLPPDYNALPCGQTQPVTFRNTSRHACGLEAGTSYEAVVPGAGQP